MCKNNRFGENMFTEIIIGLIIFVTLLGLIRSTEKVLIVRQTQREAGEEPIVYL
jgi:hypothetical protein